MTTSDVLAAVEPQNHSHTKNGVTTISLRISRQGLLLAALLFLLAISILETFELQRLHRALALWRSLPVSPSVSAAASPSAGSSALPAQVGGC